MKYGLGFLSGVILFIAGCNTSDSNTDYSKGIVSAAISQVLSQNQDHQKTLEKTNTEISGSAKNIIQESSSLDQYLNSVPDVDKPKVKKSTDTIDSNANAIIANTQVNAKTLETTKKNADVLKAQTAKVGDLESKNGKLLAERDAAKQQALKTLYGTLTVFFGLGFLTVIAGLVLAYFVNKKVGFSIAGVGVLGLALAAGSIYYLKEIALTAVISIIVSIVICVGIALWDRFKSHSNNQILRKELIDLNNNGVDDRDEIVPGATGSTGSGI